jgi:hypothetical protein
MEETKWATVTETNGLTVAEMLVQRLKAAEIPAYAEQESVGRTFAFTTGPMSMAYVKVPVQYLEEARLLLDVEAEPDEADIVTCPHCDNDVELDDAEWEQGWFDCPVCGQKVLLDDLV